MSPSRGRAGTASAPLTVVAVAHNSAEELSRLLASLDRHAPAAEVVVVDSGSRDDGAQRARAAGAKVVSLPDNPGFGAANNAGTAHASGNVVALLNPDVELRDDGLLRLAAAARERDALHVPALIGRDGRVQDSVHPIPGRPRELLRAVAPGRLRREPWRRGVAGPVGWAIAAAVVARAETLRALGPFDPRAFLFYEDLDLCLRAAERGVPTVYHPEVRLLHAGAHSTGPAYGGEPVELLVERRRAVVRERLGRRALTLDDAAQLLEHGVRAFRPRDRAYARAVTCAAFSRERAGGRDTAPRRG